MRSRAWSMPSSNAVPGYRVLATSREGLGLAGERIMAVPPLGVPAGDADVNEVRQAEAVCLFGDRASTAKRDFVLTDRNVGAVGVLCRRLDGIPLAIELAAARVRSLSPEDLVARLDQRFTLLTHGSRAALERHQTLRRTIDWSYDLLTPTERRALQRLSVFAGGCDLAAAEAVLPDDDLDALDVVDVIGQLVDKSLVVTDDTDGGVRYRLLETIRQYAWERLNASGDPSRCASPRRSLRRAGGGGRSAPPGPRTPRMDQRRHRRHRQLPRRARLGRRDTLTRARAAPGRPAGGPRQTAKPRWAGPRPRSRSPAVTVTHSFPQSPPGPH